MRTGNRLLFLYILVWPFISIAIRFLAKQEEYFSLVAVRSLFGALVLFTLALIFRFQEVKKFISSKKSILAILGVALSCSFSHLFWVKSFEYNSATVVQLFGIAAIPIGIILCSFFFKDEKAIIKNPIFKIGAAIAIAAALMSSLTGQSVSAININAIFYLLTWVVCYSFLMILYKFSINKADPLITGAMIGLAQGTMLSIYAFQYENPSNLLVFQDTLFPISIALLAGGVGMLFGTAISIKLVKKHGAALMTLVPLMFPALVAALEYFLLSQTFTSSQLVSGLFVIMGCTMCLSATGTFKPIEIGVGFNKKGYVKGTSTSRV